jgi:iron(III) transport system permease protein
MPAADVRGCLRGPDGRLGGDRPPRGNGAAALRGTTAILVVAVGVGTAIIGTSTAWLVTATRFPGHRILEVALALPLAFPAYVLAYAYTDFLDHPGIVQTTLRDLTGWGPRDYWFPEIRSTGGAAAMLTFVLYPYVYLLARAAFMRQSATAYIAARTLGAGPWGAFFKVSVPVARPAIAGGVLLALMETLADYGTVSYFGVQTFATGIYQSAGFPVRPGCGGAACAVSSGRCAGPRHAGTAAKAVQRHHDAGRRFEADGACGAAGARAASGCRRLHAAGLLRFSPANALLVTMRRGRADPAHRALPRVPAAIPDLASIAAVLTVGAAITLGFNARLHPTRLPRLALRIAGLGYAVPGGVIAVGLLVPFAALDNAVDAFMEARFGIDTGLLITGSIWLLVAAYMVRFMAAALSAYDAGLATVNPNIDAVARTLGKTPTGMLRGVHLPILRPSILTAALIVFVDVMKELPATLIMRPFNFDTLAVQAHRLAADERLAEAAVPSLVIMAVGLIPVAILCWGLGGERTTERRFVPDPDADTQAAE